MKLAVMLNSLGASQLSYRLVTQANALVGSRADLDVVALYEELARPCLPLNFASMQAAEGWGFDGPVVATSLSTAEKLALFPAAARKLFLVWDLEWLRLRGRPFRSLRAVYGHPDLTLLARSADHARAVADCWGRDAEVVGDFDMNLILRAAGLEQALAL